LINVESILAHVLKPLKEDGKFGFYHFGNEYELKEVFSSQKYNTKYPMIWLVLPLDGSPKEQILSKRLDCRIKLILATSTNKSWLNDKRNIETYEKVLNPLYDDVVKTLQSNINVIIKENEINVRKLHNYYEREQGTRQKPPKRQVNDYWDVILMEFDAIIKQPDPCEFQEKPANLGFALFTGENALFIGNNALVIN